MGIYISTGLLKHVPVHTVITALEAQIGVVSPLLGPFHEDFVPPQSGAIRRDELHTVVIGSRQRGKGDLNSPLIES